MEKKIKVHGELDYIDGHLRYAHYELELNQEEFLEYEKLSITEQEDWIREGELILDDYRVNDIGDICEITIYK